MQEMGFHLLEGLQHRCRCMGPVSEGEPAPPAGRTTLGHVGGPRSPPSKVAGERRRRAGQGGRLSKLLAAELQCLRLGHAAAGVRGHDRGQNDAWAAVCVASARSRGRGRWVNPELRGELVSSRLAVVYVMCASVCVGKRMVYVRETHCAIGPGPGPCGHR